MKGAITSFDGDAPNGPHLALMTRTDGLATAIPIGAVMLVVLDPRDVTKITRMSLEKVTSGQLWFKCRCRNPRCTVMYKYSCQREGNH